MPIVSISLNEKILKEIDKIQKELGFSGRSEVIRTALRMLIADTKEKTQLKGIVDAILLLIHDDRKSENISSIRHKYPEQIQTQLHSHLKNNKCLEIFVLNGNAEDIKNIFDDFQSMGKVELLKLVIVS